ncbi:LexA family protein [Kiloniella majae]|uniref:LexA family protein n=1 Tax=Kiloniella majae TaxID=1938558 RepID=UPI000A279577|nr:translesion error-prone DNA polymerase V autoproteolytic subunit [Kiloniella majae]
MRQDAVEYVGTVEPGAIVNLPVYASKIPAGFPSPADDYLECRIDLNEELIEHPHSTFILNVSGDSMIGAGIMPGGKLVVDKSIEPSHGKIVIAVIDGQLTVKRLYKQRGVIKLMPDNPKYTPLIVKQEQDLLIWGVVTNVINPLY